jgi:hypothetical protein
MTNETIEISAVTNGFQTVVFDGHVTAGSLFSVALPFIPLVANLCLIIAGGLRKRRTGTSAPYPVTLCVSSVAFLCLVMFNLLWRISDALAMGVGLHTSGHYDPLLLLAISHDLKLAAISIPGIAVGLIGAMLVGVSKKATDTERPQQQRP